MCCILLCLLRRCEICYFSPPRSWLFLCSAQMFRKWIPAPAPVWHWPRPALQHPQLLLYLADQLSCDTYSRSPSISIFGIKGKTTWRLDLSGKSVFKGQVPWASLFRSILRINERSFTGLQEAGAPQHPSCRINKWTVDFSGVALSYF